MIKSFVQWEHEVCHVLEKKSPETDWRDLSHKHRRQLKHLQKERFAHLFVMLFVGLYALLSFLATLITKHPALFLLDALFTALFIPYMFYYRTLENTVERWYEVEKKIDEVCY